MTVECGATTAAMLRPQGDTRRSPGWYPVMEAEVLASVEDGEAAQPEAGLRRSGTLPPMQRGENLDYEPVTSRCQPRLAEELEAVGVALRTALEL